MSTVNAVSIQHYRSVPVVYFSHSSKHDRMHVNFSQSQRLRCQSDDLQHPVNKGMNERDESCQLQYDDSKHGHNNAEHDVETADEYANRSPTAPLTPVRDAVR